MLIVNLTSEPRPNTKDFEIYYISIYIEYKENYRNKKTQKYSCCILLNYTFIKNEYPYICMYIHIA